MPVRDRPGNIALARKVNSRWTLITDDMDSRGAAQPKEKSMDGLFAAGSEEVPIQGPDGGEVVESLDQGRITFDSNERIHAEVRDPVCGTGLPSASGPTAIYKGVHYYFCGETCRREFINDPVRFVGHS